MIIEELSPQHLIKMPTAALRSNIDYYDIKSMGDGLTLKEHRLYLILQEELNRRLAKKKLSKQLAKKLLSGPKRLDDVPVTYDRAEFTGPILVMNKGRTILRPRNKVRS